MTERNFDSFAYRHRVSDVMGAPAITVDPDATLAQAAERMTGHAVSALVVTGPDGTVGGIITERDLVRAVASGVDLAATPVERAMTADVATIAPESFVYVAMGRMQRLGIRHLPVVSGGRLVGVVSARALLKLRSAAAPVIGDAISVATGPDEVAARLAELPGLAEALLADGCSGHEVTAVIAGLFRDATRRAAQHAEAELAAQDKGPAPAAYAYLILGSGGRGESLLKPDQDNAIIHAGGEADDPWFAAFGRLASDFLDAAGVPYCRGGVMASEPQWRRSAAGWRSEVGRWIARSAGESMLNVDIFFDLQPVHGDAALAESLRADALALAARSPLFLRLLASELDGLAPPFGALGGLRRDRGSGRLDAKLGGLLPAVGIARIMALATRIAATATPARLRAAVGADLIEADAAEELIRAHGHVLAHILRQQVADHAAGQPPGNGILLDGLSRARRRELSEALHAIHRGKLLVRDALTAQSAQGRRS